MKIFKNVEINPQIYFKCKQSLNCKYFHFTYAFFCKSHSILQSKLFITILVTVNTWPPFCDRNYE